MIFGIIQNTFRELVSLWKEKGYCEVIETDNKHIWLNI